VLLDQDLRARNRTAIMFKRTITKEPTHEDVDEVTGTDKTILVEDLKSLQPLNP